MGQTLDEPGPHTCTPRMPKIMKKAQQMRTMFPMGLSDDIRVSTTSLRPGARLMTLHPGRGDMLPLGASERVAGGQKQWCMQGPEVM